MNSRVYDDKKEILNKMIKADVIVMLAPVYFYSIDAQLKTLIDRTLPRYTERTIDSMRDLLIVWMMLMIKGLSKVLLFKIKEIF